MSGTLTFTMSKTPRLFSNTATPPRTNRPTKPRLFSVGLSYSTARTLPAWLATLNAAWGAAFITTTVPSRALTSTKTVRRHFATIKTTLRTPIGILPCVWRHRTASLLLDLSGLVVVVIVLAVPRPLLSPSFLWITDLLWRVS